LPEWLRLTNEILHPLHQRIGASIEDKSLPLNTRMAPLQAAWFYVASMEIADQANRDGLHAVALALTRQCIETLSLIELGLSRRPEREKVLEDWIAGKITPGNLRKWLSKNLWPAYGNGIWQEDWESFMASLANAVQPYAHYTPELSRWQNRLHHMDTSEGKGIVEFGPKVYDPQKASRITLYHAILSYALSRIWAANFGASDPEFAALSARLGRAIGKSRYLDGHGTDWPQQFWAFVWDSRDGSPILE